MFEALRFMKNKWIWFFKEKDETAVVPEQILVESEERIIVKPILKQKADSDSAKTREPKQKSFADILASKSNTVSFQFDTIVGGSINLPKS